MDEINREVITELKDDFYLEELVFKESDPPITQGTLRAYIFTHEITYGVMDITLLAHNLRQAKDLYIGHMEENYMEYGCFDFDYNPSALRKIIEKPLRVGVLLDTHIME